MTEKKYIECEAAMAAACKALCHPGVLCPDFKCAEVRNAFNAIPAADVRPVVRAGWEEKEKDGVWWYACSVCGEHIPKGRWGQEWHSNFCPNCGADMRGGQDV